MKTDEVLDEVLAAFADLKKKKKKIKDEIDDDPTSMFADLKKKKKKKAKDDSPLVDEQEETEINQFSELKKKKKKTRADIDEFEASLQEDDNVVFGDDATNQPHAEQWGESDRDYTYNDLLDRVYRILNLNNPEMQKGKGKISLPLPQVLREGTKKTAFANVINIANQF